MMSQTTRLRGGGAFGDLIPISLSTKEIKKGETGFYRVDSFFKGSPRKKNRAPEQNIFQKNSLKRGFRISEGPDGGAVIRPGIARKPTPETREASSHPLGGSTTSGGAEGPRMDEGWYCKRAHRLKNKGGMNCINI